MASEIMVREKLETFYPSDLEGSIDKTIDFLVKLRNQYPGWELAITFHYEIEEGKFRLVLDRPENEEEKTLRLKQNAALQELQRQQYELLKQEFEGK